MSDVMLNELLDRFSVKVTSVDIAFPAEPVVVLDVVGEIVVIAETLVTVFTLKGFFERSDFAGTCWIFRFRYRNRSCKKKNSIIKKS